MADIIDLSLRRPVSERAVVTALGKACRATAPDAAAARALRHALAIVSAAADTGKLDLEVAVRLGASIAEALGDGWSVRFSRI